MQFSYALVAAAACAVANAVIITNGPASFVGIQAGRALNISWADADGPVTLTLKTGEANALTTVSTIVSGLSGTSYAWSIPSTLPEEFYALQINDSTDTPNYSVRFEITGGPAASSSASGSSTSTASPTAAANSTVTSSSASRTGTASSTSSGSSSRTATSSSSSGTSTPTAAPTSAGSNFASPLAFVLLAFGALMSLN